MFMKLKALYGVYYSACGNTRKVIETAAETLQQYLHLPITYIDFTLPAMRKETYVFPKDALVLFGSSVYAGRLPNKMLTFLQNHLQGNNTLALAILTYGNRAYDQAVDEAIQELHLHGFRVIGAAAMSCQHAFTEKLATSRPNEEDKEALRQFLMQLVQTLLENDLSKDTAVLTRKMTTKLSYYKPLKEDGTPAHFLKATPKTRLDLCTKCGICATHCPMGAISFENFYEIIGTCIKCQSCVQSCLVKAKYFDDADFLSHVAMLEKNFQKPKENTFWLANTL